MAGKITENKKRNPPRGKNQPGQKKPAVKKSSSFQFKTLSFLEPVGSKLDSLGSAISEDHLIRWDRKSLGFLALSVMLFFFLVLGKIHYSSIGCWDQFAKAKDTPGNNSKVLSGTPKFIRIDEWRVITPYVLSQSLKKYPVENYSLGVGKVPLVMNLPAHHFTAFFQPQNYGFFLFPIEHGFSFLWNYRVFGLIISTFVFLLLMTGNNFWLSLFGSLFLFFSSFIQWWFSTNIGEYLTCLNMILILTIYLIFSRKSWKIIASALILLIFLLNFTLMLYPPFQIPLGLLMITILAGYLVKKWNNELLGRFLILRILLITGIIVVFGFILFRYYQDIRETMEITLNTVYPGRRRSLGGEFGWDRFFSGFFSVFMNEKKFIWMNICETSSFIFLFPAVVVAVAIQFFRKKREPVLIALSIYLVFIMIYILIGFFPLLAKVTLLSFVPSERAVIGVGIANIYLIVLYLAAKNYSSKIHYLVNIALGILFLIVLYVFGNYLNSRTNNFLQAWQVGLVGVFFAAITVLILNQKKWLSMILILAMVVASTYNVFPISRGMGFFFDKTLYKEIRKIVEKDPEGRWLVFNDPLFATFVMTTGADVFNGTKYTPDIPVMRMLDEGAARDSIYNRYANIAVVFSQEPDKVGFQLLYPDYYQIAISPISKKLKEMKIKYLLIPSIPGQYNVEAGKQYGLVPVIQNPIDNLWIIQIMDNPQDKH